LRRPSSFRDGRRATADPAATIAGPVARSPTAFVCSSCGHQSPKWLGRCPECAEWNSLHEEVLARPSAGGRSRPRAPVAVTRLGDVDVLAAARLPTGIGELDRVVGGGLVPGSLVLIGGEPGVGKSSLLLQALAAVAAAGGRTLLVCGEESPAQVRLRAQRLGAGDGIRVLADTDLDTVCDTIVAEAPAVCVVDSVQTIRSGDLQSAPGSVAQVRESAERLLRVAKRGATAIVLVGHVTKDGTVAGPRVLEHLVDAVLQFEGDRYRHLRVLRAVKNRFGSTDEIGIFEMTDAGLQPVTDPSAALAEPEPAGPGSVLLPAIEGTRPIVLEMQALVAPTDLAMPRRQATGFDRNRLSMIVAVLGRHAGVALGASDIFVNVAGGVRVDEPAADLAVALAIVSSARGRAAPHRLACFGELGLTGRVRPVSHTGPRLAEAAKLGVSGIVCPPGTTGPIDGLSLRCAGTLEEAIELAFDRISTEGRA
jgi:DNA repair protein RadA/Sms